MLPISCKNPGLFDVLFMFHIQTRSPLGSDSLSDQRHEHLGPSLKAKLTLSTTNNLQPVDVTFCKLPHSLLTFNDRPISRLIYGCSKVLFRSFVAMKLAEHTASHFVELNYSQMSSPIVQFFLLRLSLTNFIVYPVAP